MTIFLKKIKIFLVHEKEVDVDLDGLNETPFYVHCYTQAVVKKEGDLGQK